MNKTNCPSIAPIPGSAGRPFWSVMIPTYNPDPTYLEQALRGVLDQDPGSQEMQIVLVDDGSDAFDPELFLGDLGVPRVSFYRQPRHVGIAGNWNSCLEQARGQWVHLLHQDDLVLPGFYQRLRKGIETDARIGAAFCQHFLINGDGSRGDLMSQVKPNTVGILKDWLEYVFVVLSIQTPSIVVKRSVYERVGGFDVSFKYALDWDMWKRIATQYPLWYEPEPLACYRRHGQSTTRKLMHSGSDMVDIRRSIETSESYLQPAVAAAVTERARNYWTKIAIRNAGHLLFLERDLGGTIAQLWQARKISSSSLVVKLIVKLTRENREEKRLVRANGAVGG
jgi:glycosyltransferase involved in cell wall biosynthesis